MLPLKECQLPCVSETGSIIAHLQIIPALDSESPETSYLVAVDPFTAREYGETQVQLRELGRYEYAVIPVETGRDLRLRCNLAQRRRSLKADELPDEGWIDTKNFCGTLLFEIVEGPVDHNQPAVAKAYADVRSLKLNYRTEYRGMLHALAEEMAGLIADARVSAKAGFLSSFQERRDEGWLQLQLEMLREIIDSPDFSAALQRIISFPHERLTTESDWVSSDRPLKWSPAAVRQLVTQQPRRQLPPNHPLRVRGLSSIAERVSVPRKARDLDTSENRFIKFVLCDFHSFLSHCISIFDPLPSWAVTAALARRLSLSLENWLGRGFFQDIGQLRFAPLGSPVLQRKAGYRELLRWWLRFRTAAGLSWKGGEDLFRAGQRNVADLYEYWLFFQLLKWFCDKFNNGNRPPIDQLIEGLDNASPNLRLKKRTELGPFSGTFTAPNRSLQARFSYNREFPVSVDRSVSGSWTRKMHPDYTLTFWPDGLEEAEAEKRELLVHIHFDAKYRLESIERLFGTTESDADEEDNDHPGNYKRQDLLKMHAYRDAIRRSQGAYLLYPGKVYAYKPNGTGPNRWPNTMRGFHEILPGLGAFAVVPDEGGRPLGFTDLTKFLDEILEHLANRTTAQERVSFHIAEAYKASESPVPYGSIQLPESDIYGNDFRALPPAEAMVLVAWYEDPVQLELAQQEIGFVYVRLGRRSGSFHVHPNLAKTRYVLLHTHNTTIAEGLLRLREPGFRVYTRTELRDELNNRGIKFGMASWQATAARDDDEYIYALFKTAPDEQFSGQQWNSEEVIHQIEAFETDVRNKLVVNVGRTSAYPRILPLRDLLKARIEFFELNPEK